MAVTGKMFGNLTLQMGAKEHGFIADSIKCMLTTVTYVPDQDVHDYYNDVTNEVTGTGYTAGGAALGTKTFTYTAATNKVVFDAADTVWTTSTITARNAVVYNDTPAATTAKGLLCYQASDADISSTAGDFTVAWAAAGILEWTIT